MGKGIKRKVGGKKDCYENKIGNYIFGMDYEKKYPLVFNDDYKVYVLCLLIGNVIAFLAVSNVIPSIFGFMSILTLPSLSIVFCDMNIQLVKMVSYRFFTVLKSVYILISGK